MTAEFNPYVHWLGLKVHELPPDHYRLLGLKRFSSDPQAIVAAADQRMREIRGHQTGPRGIHTQSLLNELASAKLCLLDPTSKQSYDDQLRARLAAGGSGPPLPPPTPPPMPVGISVDQAESIGSYQQLQQALAGLPVAKPLSATEESSGGWKRIAIPAAIVAGLLLLAGVGGAAIGLINSPDEDPVEDGQPVAVDDAGDTDADQPPPPPEVVLIRQEGDGGFRFPASVALLSSALQRAPAQGKEAITGWGGEEEFASWNFQVIRPGFVAVHLEYWAPAEAAEAKITVEIPSSDARQRSVAVSEEGAMSRDEFPAALKRKGEQTLTVRISGEGADLVQLNLVRFEFKQAL